MILNIFLWFLFSWSANIWVLCSLNALIMGTVRNLHDEKDHCENSLQRHCLESFPITPDNTILLKEKAPAVFWAVKQRHTKQMGTAKVFFFMLAMVHVFMKLLTSFLVIVFSRKFCWWQTLKMEFYGEWMGCNVINRICQSLQ